MTLLVELCRKSTSASVKAKAPAAPVPIPIAVDAVLGAAVSIPVVLIAEPRAIASAAIVMSLSVDIAELALTVKVPDVSISNVLEAPDISTGASTVIFPDSERIVNGYVNNTGSIIESPGSPIVIAAVPSVRPIMLLVVPFICPNSEISGSSVVSKYSLKTMTGSETFAETPIDVVA